MRRILFLTSTNLASNPRCLKELNLAYQSGYQITLLAFQFDNWTKDKEASILESFPGIQFYYISSSRKPIIPWAFALFLEKFCRFAFKCGLRYFWITAFGASRRSFQMNWALRHFRQKYSLIVAHNPGAFFPALYLSRKSKIPIVLDIEDYHPGEGNNKAQSKIQGQLLIYALKNCDACTFASQPIMQQAMNLLELRDMPERWYIVENRFPSKDFPSPCISNDADKLQLVWFSQHIASSRGLEIILPLLDEYANHISLTLIGQVNLSFFETWLKVRPYVRVLQSMSQAELHQEIGKYDIGLAIEPGKDLNNNLAVSNKIWTYFQAGLIILATPTSGHIDFLNRFPANGRIVDLNQQSIHSAIEELRNNLLLLRAEKEARWQLAQQYGWEHETDEISNIWKKLMTD